LVLQLKLIGHWRRCCDDQPIHSEPSSIFERNNKDDALLQAYLVKATQSAWNGSFHSNSRLQVVAGVVALLY
jgi:hypothetical protein